LYLEAEEVGFYLRVIGQKELMKSASNP